MNRRTILARAAFLSAAGICVPLLRGSQAIATPMLGDLEARYIEDTLSTGSLSLLTSQVAVRNVNNEEVRRFAGFEIGEQQVLADVLNAIKDPRRLSGVLSPPSDAEAKSHMDAGEKRTLEKLTAGVYGKEYDRNYLEGQHTGHQKLLRAQDDYLKSGKDDRVVVVAKLARSRISEHLDLIEVLQRAVG